MSNAAKLAKAAGLIMVISLLSRILGFGRETVMAAKFGAGIASDSYVMATTIPLIIFQLVGSSIATTFIPVFTEYITKEGKEKAYDLVNNIINILVISCIIISVLGIIATPFLVKLIAPGYGGLHFTLTVRLTRIMFPIIIVVALVNIITGVLQAQNSFISPASVGIPYNVVMITALIFFTARYGIYAVSIATIVASALQIVIMIPDLIKLGYRYKFIIKLNHPGIIKIFSLVLPVLIGSTVSQINVIVDRIFASGLTAGSVASLNYANRLNGFVMGIFGMAISTVIYPTLSKYISIKNYDNYKKAFRYAVDAIFMVMIPVTILTIILRFPIVNIVYKRGAFDNTALNMTALALLYLVLGSTAFSLRDIINRAYYSLQDTLTPMLFGVMAVIINIISNLVVVKRMGVGGLAFSTSFAATVTSFIMFFTLSKKTRGINGSKILISLFKITVSSVVMGFAANFLYKYLSVIFAGGGIIDHLMNFALTSAISLAIYAILLYLLKVDEMMLAINMIVKKYKSIAKGKNMS